MQDRTSRVIMGLYIVYLYHLGVDYNRKTNGNGTNRYYYCNHHRGDKKKDV